MPELVGLKRANCLTNLGTDYCRQNNFKFEVAITQYTTALAMPELVGEARARCHKALESARHKLFRLDTAITLANLGNAFYQANNFEAAIIHWTATLDIPEWVGEERAKCHANLGNVFYQVNNFAAAIIHWTATLDIPEWVGEERANCLSNLGFAYLMQNNFADAIAQTTAALAMPELVGLRRTQHLTNLGLA
jgi:tetratricopeptide (TPR) repeat protein